MCLRYFSNLAKLGRCRHILVKTPNTKFHKNPFRGIPTERHDYAISTLSTVLTNAPNKETTLFPTTDATEDVTEITALLPMCTAATATKALRYSL